MAVTASPLEVVPLGGLGEFGMNMMAVSYAETTVVVDAPDRISASFEIIDGLTRQHGLVTSELVPAMVSIDDGKRVGGTALAEFPY